MAIIKCKMCGGDMVLNEEKTFGTCEYCGSTMTLPKVSDDQRAARFNRGNHFRRQGEFDKALAVYESIVREDDNDAEAHWCCALCRFGIEYVEDPNTLEYLPTCHRASFDSFLEDVDYLAALEHSDGITRRQYQKDAAKIAEVQKGILATSQNEEPFDVFICYKETDDDTKERTRDSLDAQEIYYQLTQEGYRVFFSRITLEDKVGTEYEPYIFAALNSAKVMVAIGSKPEYFNAVWVKNEWSRFLAMMRKDRSKLLLPCYKGMDPYDLPEQLGVLQSYDMSKIGFMQDLIRGIKKLLRKDEPKPEAQATPQQVVVRETTSGGPSTANLMRRGTIFLEEQNWTSAEEYFNKVLDMEAENGNAYLGLALTKARCANLDAFVTKLGAQYTNEAEQTLPACESAAEHIEALSKKLAIPGYLSEDRIVRLFDYSLTYNSREAAAKANKDKTLSALHADRNYTRAVQYADPALKTRLAEAEKQIAAACDRRIERAKSDAAAAKADVVKRYEAFLSEQEQDAEELSRNAADRRERDYREACEVQKTAGDEVVKYRTAAAGFMKLAGYRDAEERAAACKSEADRLEAEQKKAAQEAEARAAREAEKKAKKNRIITMTVLAAAALVVGIILLITKVIIPANNYKKAEALLTDGKYWEAIAAFEALGDYKDSADRIPEAKYKAAEALLENGEYEEAVAAFEALEGYKDSADLAIEAAYSAAEFLLENGEYEEAIAAFEVLDGYKDSAEKLSEIRHSSEWMKQSGVGESVFFGNYEQDNNTSNGKEDIEWIVLAKESSRILVISKYALDCKQYYTTHTYVTWETCSLRKWLNNEFLNATFTAEEQKLIPTVTVSADKNPEYSASPGNTTQDRVFLLSIPEVNKYFKSDEARKCAPTDYAIAQGAYTSSSDSTGGKAACWWWLRSPGRNSNYAAYVSIDGSVYNRGNYVLSDNCAVRPALWINLEP